jgi:hypothetical protein
MPPATVSVPTTSQPVARSRAQVLSRHEVLRDALLETVDHLARRRADLIDETFIDNYVALGWLEWHGGHLRLSTLGSNICAQMSQRAAAFDD